MVAWAAGFFDGEGSVSIRHSAKSGQYWLYIQAAQIQPEPLGRLLDLFGGSITRPKPRQESWAPVCIWNCSCRKAAAALAEMLPYLTVKRPHAELAAEFVTHLSTWGGQFDNKAPDRTGQADARRRMAELNRRGSARKLPTEEAMRAALGLDYIEPKDRSAAVQS